LVPVHAVLSHHPIMSTYPCEAPLWQQLRHLGFAPLNPHSFILFKDWAMASYQIHAYFNFLLMVLAPQWVCCIWRRLSRQDTATCTCREVEGLWLHWNQAIDVFCEKKQAEVIFEGPAGPVQCYFPQVTGAQCLPLIHPNLRPNLVCVGTNKGPYTQ